MCGTSRADGGRSRIRSVRGVEWGRRDKMKHHTNDRKPPLPSWYGSCEPGICRWCGCCIVRPDGRPSWYRWHRECAELFKFMFWPDHARQILLAKRGYVCQDCGIRITYRKTPVRDQDGRTMAIHGAKWGIVMTEVAELHHVIPLVSYPHDDLDPYRAWKEENCVLLCHACHVGPAGRHAQLRQEASLQGRLFNL